MQINININISEEIFDKAKAFADASVDSSADKYARRNQNDLEKIKQDIKTGRIGEEIVYQELKKHYPDLTAPDYNIYDASSKSWDTDLKDSASGIKIAVKTQDYRSDLEFGTSWVFQFNNNKNFDCDTEIFKDKDDNHYVALVSLNIPKRTARIRAIVKTSWLHENKMFKDMKQEYLKNNKLAVYYDDLEKFEDKLNSFHD